MSPMSDMSLLLLLVLPSLVLGHGNMVHPPNWFDTDGIMGMNSGAQCSSGSDLNIPGVVAGDGVACMWFTNQTFVEEDTLPVYMRTFDGYIPEYGDIF